MSGSASLVNWGLLAKISLLVTLIAGGLVLAPGAQCTYRVMNGAQIQGLAEDGEAHDWMYGRGTSAETADVQRVGSAGGFIGGFFGSIGPCMMQSVTRSQPWQQAAAGGGLIGFIVLSWLNRLSWKRGIRKAVQDQSRTPSKSKTRATSAVGGEAAVRSGSQKAVPAERPTRTTAAAAVPSRTQASAAVPSRTSAQAAVPSRAAGEASPRRTTEGTGSSGPRTGVHATAGLDEARSPRREATNTRIPTVANAAVPSLSQTLSGGQSRNKAVAFQFDDDWEDAPISIPAAETVQPSKPEPMDPKAASSMDTFAAPPRQDRNDVSFAATMATDDVLRPRESDVPPEVLLPSRQPRTAEPVMSASVPAVEEGPVSLATFKVPAATRMGRDLQVAVALTRVQAGVAERMRISVELHGRNRLRVMLLDTTASDLDGAAALADGGKAILRISWRTLAAALRGSLDALVGPLRLELTAELDGEESYAGTELVDSLTLRFAAATGGDYPPGIVRLFGPDGHSFRAPVGHVGPGLMRVESILPGTWDIELEDELRVHVEGFPPSRRARVMSDALDAVHEQLDPNTAGVRELVVADPVVIWVRAGASGDGSRERPVGSIEEAFVLGDQRRSAGTPEYTPVEIRVEPEGVVPAHRPGIIGGADGPWMQWWCGRPADSRKAWTVSLSQLPVLPPPNGNGFYTPLHFEAVDDLRIINAAYADLRSRAAFDPELSQNLDREYGALPMVSFHPAPPGHGEPSRLRFLRCRGLRLEGLHVAGRTAQTGLYLDTCEEVVVHRCWFERCVAGASGSGVWAVGRGVHVSNSGSDGNPIEFIDCDIGWNNVTRPSMPVRGAALAAYDSWVALTRCYLHDNVASQDPPDVLASGSGQVQGDSTNQRAGNLVVRT
jgi:hypothetical protein